MDAEERVQWVYDSKSSQEVAARYDDWAGSYEQDLLESFGYTAPEETVAHFAKYVSTDARILDAGSGTGLVGKILRWQGYRHLVALDISEGMLAEAAKKKVYSELHQAALGEPLDFAPDSFDAVISVGVFTLGHAPAAAFNELTRITKPGGYIVFSLNMALYGQFEAKLSQLIAARTWELVETSQKFFPMPLGEPDVALQALVYRITEEAHADSPG